MEGINSAKLRNYIDIGTDRDTDLDTDLNIDITGGYLSLGLAPIDMPFRAKVQK